MMRSSRVGPLIGYGKKQLSMFSRDRRSITLLWDSISFFRTFLLSESYICVYMYERGRYILGLWDTFGCIGIYRCSLCSLGPDSDGPPGDETHIFETPLRIREAQHDALHFDTTISSTQRGEG